MVNMGLVFLLGTLVSAIINHFLDLNRQKQIYKAISFYESARELRRAFSKVLTIAKKNGDDTITDINRFIKEEIIIQGMAIEDFLFFISKCKKNDYQECWDNYKSKVYNGGIAGRDTSWEVYKELIHKILQFTIEK